MSKKIVFIIIGIIFFSLAHRAGASLIINEIMYDLKTGSDDGREWVEIYNNTDTEIDFTNFRFFEADTNHKLKLIQGNGKIGAGEYAVIVSNEIKFKNDWPSFAGTIFDSTFSLNNSGEILALKDNALNIVNQYSYTSALGGAGDGNSLQLINGLWRTAPPSPGAENKITPPSTVLKTPTPTTTKLQVITQDSSPEKIATPILESVDLVVENKIEESLPTINSNFISESSENTNNSLIYIVILLIFVSSAGGATYFIRRKKNVPKVGDDFEILDE